MIHAPRNSEFASVILAFPSSDSSTDNTEMSSTDDDTYDSLGTSQSEQDAHTLLESEPSQTMQQPELSIGSQDETSKAGASTVS